MGKDRHGPNATVPPWPPLAFLLRGVWLASRRGGPRGADQPGFTPADARYLLYLLSHVRGPGKIDHQAAWLTGTRVLHKAG